MIYNGILSFISKKDTIISNSLSWFEIKESQCNKCGDIWYDFLYDNIFNLDILGCYQKNKKKNIYQ